MTLLDHGSGHDGNGFASVDLSGLVAFQKQSKYTNNHRMLDLLPCRHVSPLTTKTVFGHITLKLTRAVVAGHMIVTLSRL